MSAHGFLYSYTDRRASRSAEKAVYEGDDGMCLMTKQPHAWFFASGSGREVCGICGITRARSAAEEPGSEGVNKQR